MQVIKGIKLVTAINPNNPVHNQGKNVPYLGISDNDSKRGVIEVSVADSDLMGVGRLFTNQYNKDNFMSTLQKFSPYGFIGNSSSPDTSNYMIVVDDMSQAFLDTVDSVEIVNVRVHSDLGKAMASVANTQHYIGYHHLDDLMSLFSFESDHWELYTLYKAMQRQRVGWRNNEFYLFSHKDTSNHEETMLVCYKVTFTEPDSAKALLAGVMVKKQAAQEQQTTIVGQARRV